MLFGGDDALKPLGTLSGDETAASYYGFYDIVRPQCFDHR